MIQENMHEAKTHFSALVQRVLAGDKVVIAKAGHPVVQIVPYQHTSKSRTPGSAFGQFEILGDFDAPLCEKELEMWGL
ncbi:MAG: type II toxin-antitoxin system Phd/YefM family antitoxin [Verrucomicrobia bacterium]|nr:type II toxin-antitoxin system Phd/YefM family antitoxin [Verrucomicrobiota bacterium]